MHREFIIENQVKVIFWVTSDEMVLLAHHAPDFWAFRHRVIEFPTGRSSRKDSLPSGTLLWHHKKQILNLNILREKIAYQQELLQNFSSQHEKTVNYLQVVEDLAYYLWLIGENQEVTELLHREIKQIDQDGLADSISMLLNALAVNSYDQGNSRDALDWINQALELDSGKSLLWSNHGIICRSAGQARKSLSSLKKATKLNPSSYESWGVLGYVYMSLGKYSTALQNFDKALALCLDGVQFYPALAICYNQTGNIDEFERIMRQLSRLTEDEAYFPICFGGLSGDMTNALARLKELILDENIPQVFARRDPNLHFIFGQSVLQDLL
jgi:tetratricopeptide (TPR) repeat protein